MRIFAEAFFAEALQVKLSCARPFPNMYRRDLSNVGGIAVYCDAMLPEDVVFSELYGGLDGRHDSMLDFDFDALCKVSRLPDWRRKHVLITQAGTTFCFRQ